MDQKKIGKYIAEKRKQNNFTQSQLAELMGVGDKAVSKWERGISLPDVSKYQELCNILDISLNEFFAGEDLNADEIAAQSEQTIIEIANDIDKQRKRRNSLSGFLVTAVLVLCLITSANIRTHHSLLVWDYDIASWAFSLAVNDINEGELSNREILIELGDKTFNAIWQTRDIEASVFINSKWYSDNLYNFLFECTAANDLSDQEVDALIGRVPGISAELETVDFDELRNDGTAMWHLKEIFTVIENVDNIAEL